MLDANRFSYDERKLASEVHFYTIKDLEKMTGWSSPTVHKLFNDPTFPATDFGKIKVAEAHALIDFFSVRHEKEREKYWR